MNKCALIIGGSRGIGHACAVALAHDGYDVAITYATAEKEAVETKKLLESCGIRAFAYQAAMQEEGVPAAICARAIADLGRIDCYVNVAGRTEYQRTLEVTPEIIDKMYDLNYRAPMLCTVKIAEHMIERGIKGNIVYIASIHALRAYPRDQIYGGLKSALARSTESIALDLSEYGIRVNCVAPGMISVRGADSEENLTREWARKVPLGRFGKAEEIAAAVAFLVSDKAGYITGVTLKVDGGLILPGMPEDASPDAGYGWGRRGK
jgi:NAD(P)-dependent dehydrogenase (short-subunit alcohol dehydrogenase family)